MSNGLILQVKVLRSKKRDDMYLYLPQDQDYTALPDALRNQFGEAEEFLSFELHEHRSLAVVEAKVVMRAIEEQGFFLQMPIDPVLLNQMMRQ